jgi:hypothetical protein
MLLMGNAVVGGIEWTIVLHIKISCAIDLTPSLKVCGV